MHAIWGAGQMAWTKMIVVVDDDVDVHDHEAVLFHLCANCDPGRDIEIVNGPLDILDHAAPRLGAGHKIGLDATRKIQGEEVNGNPVRDWPTILKMSPEIVSLVERRWKEYGF
jgi:4-hydroxy-3-polyprenylbenzoate decarboxylase